MIRLKIKGEIESPWKTPFSTAMHLVQKSFVIIDQRKSQYSNLTIQLISSGVWDSVEQIWLMSVELLQRCFQGLLR